MLIITKKLKEIQNVQYLHNNYQLFKILKKKII